jgi:hypothetical protein
MLGVPVEDAFAARFFTDQDVEPAGALTRGDGVEPLRLAEKPGRRAGVLHRGEEVELVIGGFQGVELESDHVVLKRLVVALEANQAPVHDGAFGSNDLRAVTDGTSNAGSYGVAESCSAGVATRLPGSSAGC